MTSYVVETVLREMTEEILRMHVSSVRGIVIEAIRGPFRPGNWRIEWIDVLAEDYGRARDKADELEAMRHWIVVPDGHLLDGQVYGRETPRLNER